MFNWLNKQIKKIYGWTAEKVISPTLKWFRNKITTPLLMFIRLFKANGIRGNVADITGPGFIVGGALSALAVGVIVGGAAIVSVVTGGALLSIMAGIPVIGSGIGVSAIITGGIIALFARSVTRKQAKKLTNEKLDKIASSNKAILGALDYRHDEANMFNEEILSIESQTLISESQLVDKGTQAEAFNKIVDSIKKHLLNGEKGYLSRSAGGFHRFEGGFKGLTKLSNIETVLSSLLSKCDSIDNNDDNNHNEIQNIRNKNRFIDNSIKILLGCIIQIKEGAERNHNRSKSFLLSKSSLAASCDDAINEIITQLIQTNTLDGALISFEKTTESKKNQIKQNDLKKIKESIYNSVTKAYNDYNLIEDKNHKELLNLADRSSNTDELVNPVVTTFGLGGHA